MYETVSGGGELDNATDLRARHVAHLLSGRARLQGNGRMNKYTEYNVAVVVQYE